MKASQYDTTLKRIAENIRSKRKEKKLTIQELAYRCDMERSNMSRIESGKVNVTIKTLCTIATALEIKIEDLI
ncbi:MAG: helix-turn-helix transcriptional regulator [Rikenellaceae bacterium]